MIITLLVIDSAHPHRIIIVYIIKMCQIAFLGEAKTLPLVSLIFNHKELVAALVLVPF